MPRETARRSVLLAGLGMALGALARPSAAAAMPQPGAPARIDWAARPLRLMVVEARGCAGSAAWRREVGPGYAGSAAGRAAPILAVDFDGPFPDGLVLAARPRVTPSFLLLHKGVELSRLEGYGGPRAFEARIAAMLERAAGSRRELRR
ncbi:hypothetical protein [Paracoccus spongiarum]|uniref:SoxS protein n=1 Tax=Paracoccus spongiarum TaxID=3064387 RepID=A0ABT9JCE3_9RHOB|nr:hypothetical protein [Paracoccus sp. 2205BS29-5]MDP5307498.1 hypothetical protein [Paracoccus sp. 2205BS29-5]